ncbi:PrcB C-terminal [Clostridium sp. ASBs410]|uniref:Protease stability complex PrcB-like protein n=3 Tax=Lachnospiraceae TaxID=186803 RepID=A0A2M8Z8Y8_9FIRM|nr:protease complex subunit PrcB family protein [Lacrimispora celerecrescens]EXG84740.1 PrcB C-terminal [Clostridium sp. ASBs410]PJJ29909.1 protease stability complex PrcB-like protein [[Clostridium] celerecrescens 18A]
MKRLFSRRWMIFFGLAMWVLVVRTLSGCTLNKDSGDKVRDLEFTVVADADIPQELSQIIAEKQQSPFKLTYSDDQNLYIVVGFGKQAGGGYSIAVNDLYLTDNSIVLDTELIGPEKGENMGTEPSYPFIVIKTEMSELPVVFQ